MINTLLDAVKWNDKGLVCAVVQDRRTLRVLMVAWMNAEALRQTVATGFAHYYSRSRQRQWMKGEESGHTQKVYELRLDCDGDALVLLVEQQGGIACHTGHASCFYRIYRNNDWISTDPVIKSENEIYTQSECAQKHK
ncbi:MULTISPECIES: phosphoribosyl-AMP cyclohydrolase [Snodgrassella]|uniref:phosphoribosyl-AMP cyclohydrolase n=1 Tax=Snodgrassella TaxID=1193515 RepID=UPI002269DF0D|nr:MULTISPECIES: phosphoribosyl-AMP cyclohydrolase [unclassified Snodgrassella]MCX8746814.1 phosphoribosyl-AMP cyclohydrolase [Snodgrassella sp. B3800]MCX8748579.1 phosphoribosyl-AMP cyclohydrolase [Snodgrassella sp. B3088]MCX8753536.1 phosphoribosyl-AMP cyclohydrolase [Snodgrassella sp. B3837]